MAQFVRFQNSADVGDYERLQYPKSKDEDDQYERQSEAHVTATSNETSAKHSRHYPTGTMNETSRQDVCQRRNMWIRRGVIAAVLLTILIMNAIILNRFNNSTNNANDARNLTSAKDNEDYTQFGSSNCSVVFDRTLAELKKLQNSNSAGNSNSKSLALERTLQNIEPGSLSDSCPCGFRTCGQGCYFFSTERASWMKAEIACVKKRSTLVSIDTQTESDDLFEEARRRHNTSTEQYWTNGVKYLNNGVEKWKWLNSNNEFSFTRWCPSEPNNLGNYEECMHISYSNNTRKCWNDQKCSVLLRYICEVQNNKPIGGHLFI